MKNDSRLEKLVKEWRDAQRAIDQLTVKQRREDQRPLDRMVAAHNALLKYANEVLATEAADGSSNYRRN